MINLGYKRTLTLDDIWQPIRSFLIEYNLSKFNKFYYKTCLKIEAVNINISNNALIKQIEKRNRSSGILWPLLRTYWAFALMLFLLKLATSLLLFVNPIVLDWLISFVSNPTEPNWRGFFYASLIFFSSIAELLVVSQSQYYTSLINLKMRACVVNNIYKKVTNTLLYHRNRKYQIIF